MGVGPNGHEFMRVGNIACTLRLKVDRESAALELISEYFESLVRQFVRGGSDLLEFLVALVRV